MFTTESSKTRTKSARKTGNSLEQYSTIEGAGERQHRLVLNSILITSQEEATLDICLKPKEMHIKSRPQEPIGL